MEAAEEEEIVRRHAEDEFNLQLALAMSQSEAMYEEFERPRQTRQKSLEEKKRRETWRRRRSLR